MAGLLFVLPGFLSILALSILYAGFHALSVVQAIFFFDVSFPLIIIAAALALALGGDNVSSRRLVCSSPSSP